MTALEFEVGDVPSFAQPEAPEDSGGNGQVTPVVNPESLSPTDWYNADFPHSTPDAPYGYFDKADGTPDFDRPRKRRPHGYTGDAKPSPGARQTTGNNRVTRRTASSDAQARQAAVVLASLNTMMGMGLGFLGLPMTGVKLAEANAQFEEAAYNALLNDPALCRKILAAGASGGKAQLVMAYAVLGAQIAPTAWEEYRERRAEKEDGYAEAV